MVGLAGAILSNVLVATIVAIVATVVGWRLRHPALAHGLWVLVLVKLITPPIITIPIPAPSWAITFPAWLSSEAANFVTSNPLLLKGQIESSGQKSFLVETKAYALSSQDVLGTSVRFFDKKELSNHGLNSLYVILIISLAITFIWLAMSLSMILNSLIRSRRFSLVLAKEGYEIAEANILCLQMSVALNLPHPPRVQFIAASLSPMLFGFYKWTRIVIPTGLWNELDPSHQRALLAHELSHYRRRDHLVRGLELFVGSIFFWLPIVRIARAQIERMEETCCDLNAVRAMDNDKRKYAESLLHVVDYISQRGGRMPGLASGMRPTITLEERLRSIMKESVPASLTAANMRGLVLFGSAVVLFHPWVAASSSPRMSPVLSSHAHPNESEAIIPPSSINMIASESNLFLQDPSFQRLDDLPEVPNGWWSKRKHDSATRKVTASALSPLEKKIQLQFEPGLSLVALLENGEKLPIPVSDPTSIVSLHGGTRVIVGTSAGEIRIWDVASQQSVSLLGRHPCSITSLCYHPNFGLLSGDAHGTVMRWEVQSGAMLSSWTSPNGSIQSVRTQVDGKQVVVAVCDWKKHYAVSFVSYIDPIQMTENYGFETSYAIASVFYRDGIWQMIDWNGVVRMLSFPLEIGSVDKSEVSAIAFTQDFKVPNVQTKAFENSIRAVPFSLYNMEGL